MHELAGLLRDFDEDLPFARVVAAWFLDVDVLAGLRRERSHRRVPMVWRRDEEGVHFFIFEHTAEIGFCLECVTLGFSCHVDGFGQIAAVNVDDILDFHSGHCGELVDQFQAAAVDASNADDNLVSRCLGRTCGLAGHERESRAGG